MYNIKRAVRVSAVHRTAAAVRCSSMPATTPTPVLAPRRRYTLYTLRTLYPLYRAFRAWPLSPLSAYTLAQAEAGLIAPICF